VRGLDESPLMSTNRSDRFQDLRGPGLRVVLGAMAAQMAMGTVYARGPLTPAIVEEFGWARGDLMLASSPQTWMTALASPVAGYLTGRFGARPVVLFGVIWVAFVFVGFSQMQTLWQMFALSIGIGILVASVGDVAVGSVVSRWVDSGRGLALGIVYSGSNLAGFVASSLAGLLLVSVGWRGAFVWLGLGATTLLLPIVYAMVREPPSGFRPPSAGAPDAFGGEQSSASAGVGGLALREALRTREFWLLWIALFLFYLYFIGVNSHLTLYLTDLGMSRVDVALNYAVMVGIGVLAKLGIGLIADSFHAKISLLVCFAFVVLASAMLLGISATPSLALAFVVIHGLATMAQNVVYPFVIAWCFGTKHMAEIYGVMMLALLPGGVIGPIALGYMHDALGSYDLGFQILLGFTVTSFTLLALVRPRYRQSAR